MPPFLSASSCPDYTQYSASFHGPASTGPLQLPFQRPLEICRTFKSKVIDYVIESVAATIANADLARLFTNCFPNTLDTTISQTSCLTPSDKCHPLTFLVTGDINAMWLRDSANQLMPYLDYVNQDFSLKRIFLGAIYMQSHFISIDPYANAFSPPSDINQWSMMQQPNPFDHQAHAPGSAAPEVFEQKWEIDSLASFFSLSYQYWQHTQDDSFVQSPIWMNAVERILMTLQKEQQGTFDPKTGQVLPVDEEFQQQSDRPTENQFINGRGQPIQRTGMVRSLFRPSDDATVFTFFVPGNAMMSVELDHISQLLQLKNATLASQAKSLSQEIRDAIFKYAVADIPEHGKVFAYEVDGYGSQIIMDDANVPSLLSLPYLGFVDQNDSIYQNTRKLVLSRSNPYYFEGPNMAGIGGPHVDLNYAWPMSQIVRILTSSDDDEIKSALHLLLRSTDQTGLMHESVNVFHSSKEEQPYTRPWFAWANGLFGQAILKINRERPHLLAQPSP